MVDIDKMNEDAMDVFYNGFTCAETVIYTLRKHLDLAIPDEVIAASSGFPWGLGGGGCICGALAGGTMCIGIETGKTTPQQERNPACFELTNQLHDAFKEECKGVCCRVLMRGLERDDPQRKKNCAEYVKASLRITADLLEEYREMNKK